MLTAQELLQSENLNRILIVDDEPQNLKILTEYLRDDYKIMVAKSGEQALKALSGHSLPHLILLDIVMPGMDGYELCRRLKENPLTRNIPVIFISALGSQDDEVKGFEAGAVDYISKPFKPVIVHARVKSHIKIVQQTALLDQLANLDSLTGLPNRRQFDIVLKTELCRISRHIGSLSLIMIDIDFFKQYNDTYGHTAGDSCLQKVAQAMRKTLRRAGDLLARYGGEEFAVILPDTDAEGSYTIAEEIRKAVAALKIPHKGSPDIGFVTISLGVATMETGEQVTSNNLIDAADGCLYKAKESGRNRTFRNQGS